MFDTMTITKVIGAVCGSLLIFLLGSWAAESLYHTGGGHGDDHQQAYVIDTGADEAEEAAEEEVQVPFAEYLAAADAASGEKVFKKCKACHKVDGNNGTGPYLNGVVGRAAGSADGFGYSGALVAVVDNWTPEHLNGFLENPKGYAPGNKMSFKGLNKVEDRANLVAYLQSLGG